MYWSKLTTRGTLIGGFLGLISAVILVILSKTVWVTILGNEAPIFPYDNPALFSMAIAFGGIWLFSTLDHSQTARNEAQAYEAQYIRSETGLGAAGAAAH
jgi:cation/acetate symporter